MNARLTWLNLVTLASLVCLNLNPWFYMELGSIIMGDTWYERQRQGVFGSLKTDDSALEGEHPSMEEARRSGKLSHRAFQRQELVNPDEEEDRCKRNGFTYGGRDTRRRVFWGSLLADDSWQVLHAHAAEVYGLYHTAAFIESNMTQMLYKRKMRFDPQSQNLKRLTESGMFGPDTRVTVDYYFDDVLDPPSGLTREHIQRQYILERWQKNGMRPDDIGFLSDVDEVLTRDFLLALQICNVPEFEPGQDCREPKILGSTIIFEASPECILSNRRWYHPDIIIGECVDLVGDSDLHKPPLRTWKGKQGLRQPGHGAHGPGDFRKYNELHANETNTYNKTMYPLWNGADFRETAGGYQKVSTHRNVSNVHTAFHFHNFFETTSEIRTKYLTYGHPVDDALTKPLADIHEDLNFTVRCAKNLDADQKAEDGRLVEGFMGIVGPKPIFFLSKENRKTRHKQLIEMIEEDDQKIRNVSESRKG